ncbi:AMP-binding enzyme, partial [Streptomyces tricolor]
GRGGGWVGARVGAVLAVTGPPPLPTGLPPPHGWVRTRDLGRVDARGYLRLTGRTRDIVIVDAIIHYAGPIERVLASHPDVDQAYVVGVPDERTGEAIHAFVVPQPGATPDAGALRSLVARELGEAAVPAGIVGLTEVPVAPSGKPDKAALRALLTPR